MKKMTMAALAVTALLALSCSDDENDTTTSPLRGTWKMKSVTSNYAIDGNGDGTTSTDLMTEVGSCFGDSFVEFNSGDTFASSMTMPAVGSTNCETTVDEGTYKVVQNSVRSTFMRDGERYNVIYVKTGNLLTLTVPEYETEALMDGEMAPVTVSARMVFQKQ